VTPVRRFIALYALLSGALALHAWYYLPYLADTALVSLRYSMRFASGEGLTWTDGARIEGYDNFLWIVVNAAVGSVTGFVASARALGFAGVLLAIACVGLEPRGAGVSLPRLLVGGVMMIATAPVVIGSIGGFETGLVAGVLALALRLLERSASAPSPRSSWAPGVALALLVLLRADGVFLAAGLLAASAFLPRPSLASARRAAITALPSAIALVAELAFRFSYYGKWLPASAPAPSGVAYVGAGLASSAMLVLLAAGATVLAVRRGERASLVLPWVAVVTTTATIAVAGGDGSAGFRELVPAFVALCFVAADEVATDWSRILSQRVLLLPVLALCAFLHATQSAETAENSRAKSETQLESELHVGRTLASAFGPKRPLLAVDRPGALPFASELPSLDLSAWQTPASSGSARPELVAFGAPSKPEHPASVALLRTPDFAQAYQAIAVDVPDGVEREIWIRREGSKLGIVRAADRIEVPGYLFSGKDSKTTSELDRTGHLAAQVSPRRPGMLPPITVPPGRWRLEASPSTPKLAFDVRCDDLSMQRQLSASELVFEGGAKPVSIVVASESSRHWLRSVTLTRLPDARPAATCQRPGEPLRVSAAALAREIPKGAAWTHPNHALFGAAGVVVELGPREAVRRIELSVSGNDGYTIELWRNGEVVWTKITERTRGRSNRLDDAVFELPKPVESGSFELVVKPRRGDASCGIARVVLR
jgi:hypothetical protein